MAYTSGYAYNEWTGVTSTEYTISFEGATGVEGQPGEFGYLDQDHVHFYLNEVLQDDSLRTFTTDTQITISAPLATDTVKFKRESSLTTPLVDWVSGAGVSAYNLDTNTLQMLYVAQEAYDEVEDSVSAASEAAISAAAAAVSAAAANVDAAYVATQTADWELEADTTPTLGGNLDMDGNEINGVSETEMGYLSTVSSDVQDQLDAKAPIADPTFTGEIGIGSVNVDETELGILEGATVTTDELNRVDATSLDTVLK